MYVRFIYNNVAKISQEFILQIILSLLFQTETLMDSSDAKTITTAAGYKHSQFHGPL